MRSLLLTGAMALSCHATGASAQSPLVAELRDLYQRYHQDLSRVDEIREGLERAVVADPHAENFVALAQACFMWGDIRARGREEKLAAYERGLQAARRAVELSPRSAPAHFWYATNAARWAQTSWGFRSLFLLRIVRDEIGIVLDLDPGFVPAYALAGNVFFESPGFLGGDPDKAEEMFRKGLALDPHFTEMRLGLGKTLIKLGRVDEGRRELQAVLDERTPRYLADWTLKDSPEARRLLGSLGGNP